MKINKILIICFMFLMFPFYVKGATESSDVWYGNDEYVCTSKYQDKNISTNSIEYFSYCMKAICNSNGSYDLSYYYSSNDLKNKNMIVNCLNGNSDPYVKIHKNGCDSYKSCNKVNNIKYCSTIWKYDCSLKSDGTPFTTTTKSTTTKKTTITKKTTTKKTTNKTTSSTAITTESTTVPVKVFNTKLQNLAISNVQIEFDSNVYEYDVTIDKSVNNVEVIAVPEDENCNVEVKNNTNLVNGSVITILVISPDENQRSEYKINVKKGESLSNNAKLKNLYITDYQLNFKNTIKEYTIVIKEKDKELDIKYETESENAKVKITNNKNLVSGSKITITVTAEDGTANYYYVNVLVEKESKTIGIIFIVIIVLAILAGLYYLYMKFIKNKDGGKYEYE